MQARIFIIASMLAAILVFAAPLAFAQQIPTDTVGRNENPKALLKADEFEKINLPDSADLPDPRKSAFLSAILPGMGQTYNGALWKVPLVYAGGVTFVYAVNFYNQRYSEAQKNFRTIRYGENQTTIAGRTVETWERAADQYRRQRDYMIILGVAFYGMQIVEAYVDAHLQTFDLDEELSMKVRPTLLPDPTGTMAAGLKITYTFP